jgi:cytidine deaminase
MTNEELIVKAQSVINRHLSKDRLFGDVGAALISEKGEVFTGVCLDIPGVGICAERAAIAAMVTKGEYRIKSIVAVWEDERDDKVYILPPCGICRQFMQHVDEGNLDTVVVLGKNDQLLLSELLPRHEWPEPFELT